MRLQEGSAIRKIWRKLLHWRFGRQQPWQAGKAKEPVLEKIQGRSLLVLPRVFNPRLLRAGAFLVECLSPELVPRGSRVLDMGTGSGIGAIFASDWADEVVAVDINPDAVRCARINTWIQVREDKVTVLQGDLFAPVADERFDVVLFNPPYFRGEPRDLSDHAWRSPDMDARFAQGLAKHLTPGGHALLCLSTDGDASFLDALREEGFSTELVAERDLVNEILRLHRTWR